MDIDLVKLNLNQSSMNILKFIIAAIMYGVALELKVSDFSNLLKKPKAFVVGLVNYYLLFPILTLLMLYIFPIRPSMALGLVMVTVCPGGNLANVLSSIGKQNTALTVGLTSFTTLASMLMTPLMLMFLGQFVPEASSLLKTIHLDQWEVLEGVFLILGLPLILGMGTSKLSPQFAKKAYGILNKVSFIVLILFVLGALVANANHFFSYFHLIIGVVIVHNLAAFLLGKVVARSLSLEAKDQGSMSFFMGVRNTALALALVFQFFEGLGGMAMVVAFWGITQILIGILLSQILKTQALKEQTA